MIRKFVLLSFCLLTFTAWAGPGTSNPYGGKRVLVIGVDGLRSDALQLLSQNGNAPNLAALLANGTVTWNAYAGGDLGTPRQQPTISGAGWASILTGTWTDRHNVVGNTTPAYDQPTVSSSYLVSQAPHFARLIKESVSGSNVSSITSWNWIEDYLIAAQPTWLDYHQKGSGSSYALRDADVASKAASYLASADPDVLFLHFDQVDGAGHSYGFSTSVSNYLNAITNVDTHIGTVMTAIQNRPQYASENWMIILTSDHGGTSGGAHGGQSIDERTIPLMVSGGGVPAAITSSASPGHVAVAPTVMRYLGIPIPATWQFAQPAFVTGPNLTATRSGAQVQLSWSHPITSIIGATGVEIKRNGFSIGTFPLSQTSFTDASPPVGTVTYQLLYTGTSDVGVSTSVLIPSSGQRIWDDPNPVNTWDTTTNNWTAAEVFTDGNDAYFTGSTGEMVTITASGVTPTSTQITGNGSYTFGGGSILGGTLVKSGTGTLTLNASNYFSSVTANGGSLALGSANALGTSPVTFGTSTSTSTTSGAMIVTTAITSNATLASAITLPTDTTAATRAIYMNGSGSTTLTLSGKISGGSAFTTLYLNNSQTSSTNPQVILTHTANDFRANILINRGGLQLSSDAALGNSANTVTFNSNSGADLTFGSAMTYTRATELQTTTDFNTGSNNVIASGSISGTASLNKIGTGSLTLSAANTYTSTSISAGPNTQSSAAIILGHPNALGTGAVTLTNTTSFTALYNSSTSRILPNNIAISTTAGLLTRFLAGNATTLQLDGVLSGGSATSDIRVDTDLSGGSTGLVKLTHSSNSFLGLIRINRGGLAITSDGALGNPANSITLDIGTTTQVGIRFDASLSSSRTIQLGSGKQVLNTNGHAVNWNGVISGASGQLFKSGSGTLTLGATNTYGGITTVNGGTLRIEGSLSTSTNAVTVDSSGTLSGSGTIARPVTVNGTLAPGSSSPGVLSINNALTLAPSSSLAVRITQWTGNAGTAYDSLNVGSLGISATTANKLTIRLDASALNSFTETPRAFTLATSAAAPNGLTATNWTVIPTGFNGSGSWSLRTTTSTLELVYTPALESWLSAKGLSGPAASADADPDGDGIPNAIEFVLGTEPNPANPDSNSTANLPKSRIENNTLVFRFKRSDLARAYPITVEFSESLQGSWVTAADPLNATIQISDGDPTDEIQVHIPLNGRSKLFTRLKVRDPQ